MSGALVRRLAVASLAVGLASMAGSARADDDEPIVRATFGVSPAEIGVRSIEGADSHSISGSGTYGLGGSLLFAAGDGVEVGAGGTFEHTVDPGFDVGRAYVTARFSTSPGKGTELGVAPRLGYVWASADIYQQPTHFRGWGISVAFDVRRWLSRHVALFAEVELRAEDAQTSGMQPSLGYYETPTFRVLAIAPTLGVVVGF